MGPRCEQQQVLTHVPKVLRPALCNRDILAAFDVLQRESAGHVVSVAGVWRRTAWMRSCLLSDAPSADGAAAALIFQI